MKRTITIEYSNPTVTAGGSFQILATVAAVTIAVSSVYNGDSLTPFDIQDIRREYNNRLTMYRVHPVAVLSTTDRMLPELIAKRIKA